MQAAQFFGGGRAPGDDFEFVLGDAAGVGVLKEQAAGDVLDDRARRRVADFDEAEILFGGEALAGLGREGGRGDGFDEELGDFVGGFAIDGAIDADDSTECGNGIACECLLRRPRGSCAPLAAPQGLVCLTMTTAGSSNSCASSQQASRSTRLL